METLTKIINKLAKYIPRSTDSSWDKQIKTRRLIRVSAYTGLVVMALYAVAFILPPINKDSTHATTGTAVASDTTLSISIANSTLSLDLTPTSANGTFATTTSPATINVATNNITGYTVGIRTSTNSDTATLLVNTIDQCEDIPTSTKCSLSSLDTAVSVEDYSASTATNLNNTWGYLPSKYNSIQNEDYLPAPTSTGDTINTTTGPNAIDTNTSELTTDEYTINLAARLDYTPYAGSYTNTFIVTAVGNPVPYSVSYDSNKPAQAPATANVDNVPTAQTGNVSSGDTIAVLLSNKVPTIGTLNTTDPDNPTYTYAGYVFTGWCSVQPNEDTTTGYQTCPDGATLYQPGDTFGIDQTVDNTEILYAVWGAPATVIFDGNNGLVFNDTASDTTNTIQFIPTYEGNIITGQKTNTIYNGTYAEPAPITATPPTNYVFKGWSTDAAATTPTYTTEQDILNNLNLVADGNTTLYAVWAYTAIIIFEGNGNDAGNTPMADITVEAGQTVALPQNTYTKEGYVFNGWNTVQVPTEQDPGETYADQADYTAGSQSADVTLYAQWKLDVCDANSICYKPNGANTGEGANTMSNQTKNYNDGAETDDITSNMDVQLWPINYKYDTNSDGYNDYGFAGWSEDKDAATKLLDTDTTNDPTVYGPNQTITLGDVSQQGLKLYAVWMPVAKDSSNTELTLQTANLLTTTLADGTTLADKPVKYVTALRDYRDNQVYAVAKLADEAYWMIENLRLENDATVGNNKNDSTITNQSLAEGYGGVFQGLADAESANFTGSTTANSLYSTSKIIGSNQGYRFPRYNNANTAASTTVANMTAFDNNNGNIYSLGNYYTWAAAIADTANYTSTNAHTTVATSICPTGWHLPYGNNGNSSPNLGNTKGGFYYLNYKLNNDADITDASSFKLWRSFPNNFVYSGYWYGSSAGGRGGDGSYWSSTAYGTSYVYILYFYSYSGYVRPGTRSDVKTSGYSARCVIN